MWMRAASVSDVGRIDGIDQAFYRLHPDSMTRTIHAGERLCAGARGTFIQVAQDRFLQHAREHGDPSRR